jgi:hypothetical protein
MCYAGADDSAFRALNAAFLADGAFVHVGPRVNSLIRSLLRQ